MKLKKLLILIATICFSTISFAQEVDINIIEKVAKNFYYQQKVLFDEDINLEKTSIEDISIRNIKLYSYNNIPSIYAVNFNNGGYVLVSAQKTVQPIIGFNTSCNIDFEDRLKDKIFDDFISNYLVAISNMVENNSSANTKTLQRWDNLINASAYNLENVKSKNQVGPLLSSLWNQDSPYNYYAPKTTNPGAPGGKCTAGCVATATAVIMHYWEYPKIGVGESSYLTDQCNVVLSANYGETEYNYSLMPNSLNYSYDEVAIKEVAKLQSHAGIAIEMDYCFLGCDNYNGPNANASYCYSENVLYAYLNYFKYTDATFLSKNENLEEWENIIVNQFDNGYPIYYLSCSSNGAPYCHAWNSDGYKEIDGEYYFHHNFNWSGYFNDWFSELSIIENPPYYGYDSEIIINLYPTEDNYPNYASGFKELTHKYGRISDGSGPINNYLPNTKAEWLINPQGEHDSVINITFKFNKFDLDAVDNIKIYDGVNEDAPLLLDLYGNMAPIDVTTTGNKAYVIFETQSSNEGFEFEYSCKIPSYCNDFTHTEEHSGTISSNPENKYYTPTTCCRWYITPKDLDGDIAIKFNYLDTYDEKDFVSIYDIKNDKLHTFFGNETPENELIFSNEGVFITFETDKMNSIGKGFSLNFYPTIGINDYNTINFDIYPNPAKDIINVISDNIYNHIKVEVLDIAGNILYTSNYKHKETLNTPINISHYSDGIYFVRITTDSGIFTKKIILKK
ncbi:MAG: C10 family peptidase [Bacteroidales bacterium]